MHHFNGYKTIQSEMRAEIYLCHAPFGEFLIDAYVSNCLADPLGHGADLRVDGGKKFNRSVTSDKAFGIENPGLLLIVFGFYFDPLLIGAQAKRFDSVAIR